MTLRASGNVDVSNILKDIAKSPTRATAFRKCITKEVLYMFVEEDLTRKQYNIVRKVDKQRFPCYSLLQKAKQQCYPEPEAFRVTSTCAEVKLHDTLHHTCSRLYQYLDEVFERCSGELL
ncbi:hypothetical protein JTB14_010822 [Gonioctena quinquepunctata]|nr:hypothetical protein JTB14_010822 [Gonioctena quinquepunctata]